MKPYLVAEEILGPVLRLAMPRAPRPDARDPRWTTQRAVGSAGFVARYVPPRGRRKIIPVPPQIQALGG
jgi:hypothetical protein